MAATKKIVLDGFESHFTLLAKGHYPGFEVSIDNLKIIIGELVSLKLEHVVLGDVYDLVVNCFTVFADFEPKKLKTFFTDILAPRLDHLFVKKNYTPVMTKADLISAMLSFVAVSKIIRDDGTEIDIGKPSADILDKLRFAVTLKNKKAKNEKLN